MRWLCPTKAHVLGVVVREDGKGSGVILFRQAVAAEGDITEAAQLGLVYGEATVVCSCCGQVRTWFPGAYDLERLMQKMRRRG